MTNTFRRDPLTRHYAIFDSNSGLTWDVEPETSVVTLTVNGETEWQRPVADVAVFVTSLVYGDDVELTALGAEGNILASITLGTRHPGE